MKVCVAACFVLWCVTASADSPVVFVGDKYRHSILAAAVDRAGNTYVTGYRAIPTASFPALDRERLEIFVAKLDAANNDRLWVRYFSFSRSDAGTAIAVDDAGSIYVAGNTSSGATQSSSPGSGFVMKVSNDASRLLWTRYHGPAVTRISSVAVGSDQSIVIAGTTTLSNVNLDEEAFVAKLGADGDRVIWEQRYNGAHHVCSGGSTCYLSPHRTTAKIAMDSGGSIIAAGHTNTTDLPTTAQAFTRTGCGPYIRKYSATGELIWSTYLTNNKVGADVLARPADTLSAIAVGPDNSIYFTGGGSPDWPTTPEAYRTKYEGPRWEPYGNGGTPNAYVARLSSDGTKLLYSTFIGRNGNPSSIAVDAKGNAFVSGSANAPQPDYITSLNSTGASLVSDLEYSNGSRGKGILIDAAGRIHASGGETGVVAIVEGTAQAGTFGIANAAGRSVAGRVTPGELISIYGRLLGDQVFVNDVAVPVFYSSDSQVNTIIPFSVRLSDRLTITTRKNGVDRSKAVVSVTEAQPELFTFPDGRAAALNEDGSINSFENPAKPGTIVSVWGTGAPGWLSDSKEGSVNPSSPLQRLDVDLQRDVQPVFAGAAPGLLTGVFQVNFKLPLGPFVAQPRPYSVYPISGMAVGSSAFVYVSQ